MLLYYIMTIIEFSIKNYFLCPSIVQHVDAHNMMYDNLLQVNRRCAKDIRPLFHINTYRIFLLENLH